MITHQACCNSRHVVERQTCSQGHQPIKLPVKHAKQDTSMFLSAFQQRCWKPHQACHMHVHNGHAVNLLLGKFPCSLLYGLHASR